MERRTPTTDKDIKIKSKNITQRIIILLQEFKHDFSIGINLIFFSDVFIIISRLNFLGLPRNVVIAPGK